MIERQITIECEGGLHARNAIMLTDVASRYKSEISLINAGVEGNAKSLLSVLMLGIASGTEVTLRIFGPDESDALLDILQLVEKKFAPSEK